MQGTLPDEIIYNRKQGFSAPDQSWYMNQLVQYVRGVLLSDKCMDRGYFRKEYVERILDEHIAGKANHRLLIWSLLSFEWWNRIFIDKSRIEGISEGEIVVGETGHRKLHLTRRPAGQAVYAGNAVGNPTNERVPAGSGG
jgi:hypothetical protein